MLLQRLLIFISCCMPIVDAHVKDFDKAAFEQTVPLFEFPDSLYSLLSHSNTFNHKPVTTMSITQVPAVINQPGYYTVDADLISTQAGSAVVITAQDVTLDFTGHSLTLSADNSCGIEIIGAHVTINNPVIKTAETFKSNAILIHDAIDVTINKPFIDRLETSTEPSSAICAVSSQKVVVRDASIENYEFGLLFKKSSRIRVEQTFITNAQRWALETQEVSDIAITDAIIENSAVAVGFYTSERVTVKRTSLQESAWGVVFYYSSQCAIEQSVLNQGKIVAMNTDKISIDSCIFNEAAVMTVSCSCVTCKNSTFSGASNGLAIYSADKALIDNCFFYDLSYSAITANGCQSTSIVDCTINSTEENENPLIQAYMGSVQIHHCVLTALNAHPELDGIALYCCSSADLRNITLDVNPQGTEEKPYPAAIVIYSMADEPQSSDIKIANCIVRGNAKVNILSSSTGLPNRSLSIKNCLIEGGQNGIILSNTQSSSITGCQVTQCNGNGIWITNSLEQVAGGLSTANIISNCSMITNGSNGIFIDEKVDKTLIKNNDTFNNGGFGIKANALSHLYDNISYGNDNK